MIATANRHAERENVTATVTGGIDTGLAAACAEGNPWFPQLPTAKQADVLRYAVLHIANNSSLFERNHGNDQEYELLTIAIARSGVADAETIFVEAASSANGPVPKDDLPKFFQMYSDGGPETDGITAAHEAYLSATRRAAIRSPGTR